MIISFQHVHFWTKKCIEINSVTKWIILITIVIRLVEPKTLELRSHYRARSPIMCLKSSAFLPLSFRSGNTGNGVGNFSLISFPKFLLFPSFFPHWIPIKRPPSEQSFARWSLYLISKAFQMGSTLGIWNQSEGSLGVPVKSITLWYPLEDFWILVLLKRGGIFNDKNSLTEPKILCKIATFLLQKTYDSKLMSQFENL